MDLLRMLAVQNWQLVRFHPCNFYTVCSNLSARTVFSTVQVKIHIYWFYRLEQNKCPCHVTFTFSIYIQFKLSKARNILFCEQIKHIFKIIKLLLHG